MMLKEKLGEQALTLSHTLKAKLGEQASVLGEHLHHVYNLFGTCAGFVDCADSKIYQSL